MTDHDADAMPDRLTETGAQSVLDGDIEELAQDFAALSANARSYRDLFATPRDAEGFQRRVELAILAYLELRCGCGACATMPGQVCPTCYATRQTDAAARAGDAVQS